MALPHGEHGALGSLLHAYSMSLFYQEDLPPWSVRDILQKAWLDVCCLEASPTRLRRYPPKPIEKKKTLFFSALAYP